MNILVDTKTLAHELQRVEKIVPAKTTRPILSHVLLQADDTGLRLSTSSLDASLTTRCDAQVRLPGTVTLPVKRLLDVVQVLTQPEVQLTLDEQGQVRVTSGSFHIRLQTLTPEDFPHLPEMAPGGAMIPGDTLRTLIRKIRHGVSDTNVRFFLKGALLTVTDALIGLVATDGHRLAIAMAPCASGATASRQIIVPTNTLDILSADDADDILFSMNDRQLFFGSDHTLLSSQVVEGTFPNYQRMIPKENDKIATIGRDTFLQAMRRVSLAAGDRTINVSLDMHTLTLDARHVEVGEARETIPVTYEGPALKVAVKPGPLRDFLDVAVHDTITLALKDAAGTLLLSDGDDSIVVVFLSRGD